MPTAPDDGIAMVCRSHPVGMRERPKSSVPKVFEAAATLGDPGIVRALGATVFLARESIWLR